MMSFLKKIQIGFLFLIFFTFGFVCGQLNEKGIFINNQAVESQQIIKEEEPQVAVVKTEPQVVVVKTEPRYEFTEEDIHLLALVLCGGKNVDGDGEYDIDFEKNINHVEVDKVLSVIMNRVKSRIYPNTISKVVLQPKQFSVIPRNLNKTPSDKALKTVREWCEAYNNYSKEVQLIPDDHLYFTGNGVTNTTRSKWA